MASSNVVTSIQAERRSATSAMPRREGQSPSRYTAMLPSAVCANSSATAAASAVSVVHATVRCTFGP
ncbi:hypothetical protein D3C71_1903350 [compost metagenome]